MGFPFDITKSIESVRQLQSRYNKLVIDYHKWEERISRVPPNATIREEAVKCGKRCRNCQHGPYYYAYWKENGTLKRMYIGNDVTPELGRRIHNSVT